ncbi:MAG: hypothetical protein A2312_00495 [Candidatus Staskawiczbacteria bacterium RIFOXYB2_FULL_32_9]|uniref:Uncharacterized protein n=1 Tax=Candidatus Staskawiczbacteria bacterium RIFOXYD1_FULL_32_13 TaxID=1802234 RepID=A0A1G2JRQ3_9BACT|nr:MAG: hypothetical protein UR22_C0032G0002 [Parcubacteria group bacterium GW2011_GWC2_32_10]OGZ79451.1 MAG: hypothetical protein A2360_02460 [Candidatus Staskawiczbacteria bacterium RIFOXYB1_FULL_32_11]OGZ83158.1 MAG: hypothetical protein A2312_00495 [Candidatus Staskawiczbacteria bacterium RIFOXYB2_FULL_32_9]OGZ87232.1 MAG: hypothetical protein A2463_04690 [Candidatus Staskawiczbacteria bacterium RIFOXYC2_FULL_32_10]OGZ89101.1 MAG: hypothetical protein A2561_04130 [Candidatus Staskawiczbacte
MAKVFYLPQTSPRARARQLWNQFQSNGATDMRKSAVSIAVILKDEYRHKITPRMVVAFLTGP